LNRLKKMASFRDDEAGYRGVLIEDEKIDNLVATRRDNKNTIDAEFLMHPNPKEAGVEAHAMWPGDIELAVPKDWKAGDKVPAAGPHGRILFEIPDECQAGTTMRFRLKPAADLRVEVPPGLPAGAPMNFERPDGTRISIAVPAGMKPGDQFEVTPPALMVLVPEEVKPGETVVFCMPGPPGQWFKARVPEDMQLGRYFAARLPPPDALQVKGGSPKANAVAAATDGKVASDQQHAGGPEGSEDDDKDAPVE